MLMSFEGGLMSSGPRKTANLSDSVHPQLNMYAIAATAAGAGVLALTQPGEAKIVYTPIAVALPPNSNFDLNSFLSMAPLLTLKNTRFVTGYPSCSCDLFAIGDVAHYSVTYSSRNYIFANALASGARIGPRLRFGQSRAGLANVFASAKNEGSRGQWRNVTKRYLGIRFQVNGQFHYGWARLNVSVYFRSTPPTDCKITASLSG
jgi:hypothetical protein